MDDFLYAQRSITVVRALEVRTLLAVFLDSFKDLSASDTIARDVDPPLQEAMTLTTHNGS
jgi:hypothetical protein